MEINYQTLLKAIIAIAMVFAGLLVALYCFMTKILYNEKYSIKAYQKALAKAAANIERRQRTTLVSHDQNNLNDVAQGHKDHGTCQCFQNHSTSTATFSSTTFRFSGFSPPQRNHNFSRFNPIYPPFPAQGWPKDKANFEELTALALFYRANHSYRYYAIS
ncbi:hypothetical protein VNO78_27162 [Psophocarpus tetragonolobus]|uniref:Uncharacterized protein n=1 Tax=Psophocarpus tetragonolobus TaxID=3891 RepID=A0AAN9S168_PSOTE